MYPATIWAIGFDDHTHIGPIITENEVPPFAPSSLPFGHALWMPTSVATGSGTDRGFQLIPLACRMMLHTFEHHLYDLILVFSTLAMALIGLCMSLLVQIYYCLTPFVSLRYGLDGFPFLRRETSSWWSWRIENAHLALCFAHLVQPNLSQVSKHMLAQPICNAAE